MNNSIIESVTDALLAAAGKHGPDLLADVSPADPDDTLRLARNLVARLQIDLEHGPAVMSALIGVVEQDGVADRIDGLRDALTEAISQDAGLASDLAIIMSDSAM